jgi:hypothetical protein
MQPIINSLHTKLMHVAIDNVKMVHLNKLALEYVQQVHKQMESKSEQLVVYQQKSDDKTDLEQHMQDQVS